MAYWLGKKLCRQTGRIKRFKEARQKSKERKFKKIRAKLEQKRMAIVEAPIKEITENQGEMIYGKLSQPPFNC